MLRGISDRGVVRAIERHVPLANVAHAFPTVPNFGYVHEFYSKLLDGCCTLEEPENH